MAGNPALLPQGDYADRAAVLAHMNTPKAHRFYARMEGFMEMHDTDELREGLTFDELSFTSEPDGNTVRVRLAKPAPGAGAGAAAAAAVAPALPCVIYFHGGGMMQGSAWAGHYRAFANIIAQQGVAVATVDFRNSAVPARAGEAVAPFPAGLNDCQTAVRWLAANAAALGLDASRLVVAGESGGGNLAIATAMALARSGRGEGDGGGGGGGGGGGDGDGDGTLLNGVYALCPYIAGHWPQQRLPSSTENNGYLLDLHTNSHALAYGQEEFDARNPLAWPGFAAAADVEGLPRLAVHVNECDPLRDEGVAFYRLCVASGVEAACKVALGTFHAAELSHCCPELTREAAVCIASFAASRRPAERGGSRSRL